MDTLLGAALVGLAVVMARRIGKVTRDPIHPLAVFTAVWLGVFGVAHFRLSETYDEPYYAEPFGARTYVVVLLAYVCFAVGFGLVSGRLEAVDREGLSRRLRQVSASPYLAWVALGLFGVATLTTVYFVQVAGTIPLFSPDVDALRRSFKLPLWGYLYDLHFPAALFSVMMAFRGRGPLSRIGWLGLASSSIVMLMLGGVRVSALTALVWIGVYAAYAQHRISRRAVVFVAALGLVIFVTVENARRSQFDVNPEMWNPRVDPGALATVWAHTGASFKNLQLTVDQYVSPLNMGLNSYDLPKTLVPSAREVDAQLSYIYGTHNTPTFLGFLYFDFGYAGLLFMPLAYGALVAFVYGRFRERGNLLWLLLHIDFFLAVLLTFRTHRFLGNNLIFFGGVAVVVQLLAGRGEAGDGEVTNHGRASRGGPADMARVPG